jgi:hypothetical protein
MGMDRRKKKETKNGTHPHTIGGEREKKEGLDFRPMSERRRSASLPNPHFLLAGINNFFFFFPPNGWRGSFKK